MNMYVPDLHARLGHMFHATDKAVNMYVTM